MLTHYFQTLLICFFVFVLFLLIAYGIYCKRKVNSYIGTGRVNDIEIWSAKAAASWTATFVLTLAMLLNLL